MTPDDFVRAHTTIARPALVPEIALHLATEITPIWQATETWLAERNIEPPFWAFAWPGGQATARLLLDDPSRVAGRRVLDFAAGFSAAPLLAVWKVDVLVNGLLFRPSQALLQAPALLLMNHNLPVMVKVTVALRVCPLLDKV